MQVLYQKAKIKMEEIIGGDKSLMACNLRQLFEEGRYLIPFREQGL